MRAIRETGCAGARYEIPSVVPPALIVIGDEDKVARLLRTLAHEPMVGGRRAGDAPTPVPSFDEQAPGVAGLTQIQLSAAARHMCNRSADACGVTAKTNGRCTVRTSSTSCAKRLRSGWWPKRAVQYEGAPDPLEQRHGAGAARR